MYLRVIGIALIAVFLTGTHWKAYKMGQNAVRAELQEQALKASEQARKREAELRTTVEGLDRELQKQKARNAAADRAHAERLREYQAALDRAAEGAGAAGGAPSPFARIAGECGRALTTLDQHARGLAQTARALQEYATGVCLTVPAGR